MHFRSFEHRRSRQDLGAKLGANDRRRQATPGHNQLTSAQLEGSLGDTGRHAAMVRRCLLSSGSRVRIPPGALICALTWENSSYWVGGRAALVKQLGVTDVTLVPRISVALPHVGGSFSMSRPVSSSLKTASKAALKNPLPGLDHAPSSLNDAMRWRWHRSHHVRANRVGDRCQSRDRPGPGVSGDQADPDLARL
jgi:hypothetical protein